MTPSIRAAYPFLTASTATERYLNACTMGLPVEATLEAMAADSAAWADGRANAVDYGAVVERTRSLFATLVGVDPSRVAIGSQTSAIASVLASALPAGATVLCVDGDFSSMVFPFLSQAHRGVTVRTVSLADLAESVDADVDLVAFSYIQSMTGEVADVDAVVAAARTAGARTFCDLTQAAGVHPVDASVFDATVTHCYKWLSAPRGVAFLTITDDYAAEVVPIQAGWYAGEAIWNSCYGPRMELATDARRFDVSPAWQAFVGAEQAISFAVSLDQREVWRHATTLGDALCRALGIAEKHQAIVTWSDPERADVERLAAAGIHCSWRGGRARVSFHLWNDMSDVEAVATIVRE